MKVVVPGLPVRDADDLATRVQVAAATLAAARREALAASDDDFGRDPDPREVWYGGASGV